MARWTAFRATAGPQHDHLRPLLEAYCGYGPDEALRVIDGKWLEYNNDGRRTRQCRRQWR